MKSTIGFPGLNIPDFHIDRVAFSIFGYDIYWYAIIIVFGFALATIYALHAAKYHKLSHDNVYDMVIIGALCGFVGARIYYVIFNLEAFYNAEGKFDFLAAIDVRQGGLAIYGGIIFAAIGIMIYAKVKKLNILNLFDLASSSLLIGQAVGRWGNFINMEAFGYVTNVPWRMKLVSTTGHLLGSKECAKRGISPNEMTTFEVHPTFLYESLWNILGFIIISRFAKKKKFNGQIFLMYITWYGFGRMIIEGMRTDSLYFFGSDTLRISQLIGLLTFVIGLFLLVYLWVKKNKEIKEEKIKNYSSLFEDTHIEKNDTEIKEEGREKVNCENSYDNTELIENLKNSDEKENENGNNNGR